MKILSLFSGAGGIDIGFKRSGFKTIIATDNWNIACRTLNINKISKEVICDDIRNINFNKLKKKTSMVLSVDRLVLLTLNLDFI